MELTWEPTTGVPQARLSSRELGRFSCHTDGTTLGEEQRLMSFAEFNALIGVEEKYALAERFGVQ